MKQYMDIKREYKDSILFFRMGDFYEMFFEDAIVSSKALDIALTTRDRKQAIPMCGIPYHAKETYTGRLLKQGYNVAICEQFSQEGKGGIFSREVVEVLTPGLIPREGLLEPGRGNFLVSISLGSVFSISAADISTGECYFEGMEKPDRIADALQKIDVREIIYDGETGDKLKYTGLEKKLDARIVSREIYFHDRDGTEDAVKLKYGESFPDDSGLLLLFDYIRRNQPSSMDSLSAPRPFQERLGLYLDESAMRSLEVLQSLRGGKRGTLLSILDRSKTSMGKRLIRRWLAFPLAQFEEIQERLSMTEELFLSRNLRNEVRTLLGGACDLERVGMKVQNATAGPRDIMSLKGALDRCCEVKSLLAGSPCEALKKRGDRIDELVKLRVLIEETLSDTPPINYREGGAIKEGYDGRVDELREIQRGGAAYLKQLEEKERQRCGIPSIKVKFNRVFGYFIEVSKTYLSKVPPEYIRKQTLVGSERYITEELKEFEGRQLGAKEKLLNLEEELYMEFLSKAAPWGRKIVENSHVAAEVDVLASFALAAEENGYVKPEIHRGRHVRIVQGRHPVVEKVVGKREFVPNDSALDPEDEQIMVITGPNMSGKSTYVRQIALIVLMAHAGSFIPAEEAVIPLTDSIFTRIGASDNIHLGESTFMVEMKEVSKILKEVTERSLVILDEVGRGTSTYDGLSIAWAVIEYIHSLEEKRPLTLFATHYHEICELERLLGRVKNYNVLVKEWKDEILFIRKIARGPSSKSYGIYVGEIAGLPEEVTGRAKEILKYLENTKYNDSKIKGLSSESGLSGLQLGLFSGDGEMEEVIRELDLLDPERITPIEAIQILSRMKERVDKSKKRR